ncbi:MAG: DUF4124 domain-containing protein [Nitrospira sp.]|nr:DUF4124 domain-containing protein [Nitrospira sp.]
MFLWLVVSPASSADVIYKYIDDNGVPSYTEVWDLIPERHRARAQALDPKTLEPVRTAPAAVTPQATTNAVQTAPPAPPVPPSQHPAISRAAGTTRPGTRRSQTRGPGSVRFLIA